MAVVKAWRPDLLNLTGVGPIVAATVLTARGALHMIVRLTAPVVGTSGGVVAGSGSADGPLVNTEVELRQVFEELARHGRDALPVRGRRPHPATHAAPGRRR